MCGGHFMHVIHKQLLAAYKPPSTTHWVNLVTGWDNQAIMSLSVAQQIIILDNNHLELRKGF